MAILILPLCVFSAVVLPGSNMNERTNKNRKLDVPGVGVLTACLVLFVYAISDGSHSGKPSFLLKSRGSS